MSKTGLKRNTIDKFYTNQNIAKLCFDLFLKYIKVNKNDYCIEPSAGNGAFIDLIKSKFKKNIFIDIKPEHNEIKEYDFLKFNYDKFLDLVVHTLGNPPFGRQSSMAIKFIKHASKFSDSISFILPKSFKKDSLKKHFPLNFHLIKEYDIPHNSFTVNDEIHNVPCVFQIWIKKDKPRKVPKKLKPKKFKFVKIDQDPDISFRRVGIYAGKIDENYQDKSFQSHYFIKFDKFTKDLYNELSNIEYECSKYTSGPKSISKQELIKEFNRFT